MSLMFKKRHGFINEHGDKFICYIYEDHKSKRLFSFSHKLGQDSIYVNEIDESFGPTDNTFSTVVAKTLLEAKNLVFDEFLGASIVCKGGSR